MAPSAAACSVGELRSLYHLGMLRIVGGEYRSRLLETPRDETTRPMSARAKEAICNLLRGWFEGARVLDLFAGVGTMGLESISRGASRAWMVERDRAILRIQERNIATLGCADRAIAIQGDALTAHALESVTAPLDLVFMDPPYAIMEKEGERHRVFSQLRRVRELMGERGFVILRSPLDPKVVDHSIAGLDGPEIHRYGQGMYVLLYSPTARPATNSTPASDPTG